LAKTTPDESVVFPKPKMPTKPKDGTVVWATELNPDKPLEYCQRVLAEHGGLESNIPIGHDYWRVKRNI